MANILVVDDELGIRDLLWEVLNDEGHQVDVAENAAQARLFRQNERPDLVLLDIWMPDTDGVTLLKEWSAGGLLTMPVIMMSGHATIDTAVEATKIGALAFLEKPITLHKLLKAVDMGLTKGHAKRGLSALHSRSDALGESENTFPKGASANLGTDSVNENVLSADQTFNMDKPLRDARDEFEKAYFEFHLSREGGSMTRVAEKTGLERTHLYRKLKQLGVDLSKGKKGSL